MFREVEKESWPVLDFPLESGIQPGLYSFWDMISQFSVQNLLLGHKDVKTTMIYTHVLNRGGKGVKSPVDDL